MNPTKFSAIALAVSLGLATMPAGAEDKNGPAVPASAEEEQGSLELLRAAIRIDKREILKNALKLSDKDYEKFWPIYYDYQAQLIRIYDQKFKLIGEYATKYASFTDQEADRLVKASFAASKAQTALLEKYYGQVAKAFSKVTAARFVQVENALNGAFDLKLRSRLPLVPDTAAAPPAGKP